jgi:hypothetical protein
MGDTATLVRLVAASGLVGLLAYCVAHVVQVWRKRNKRPDSPGGARPGRKLAWVCLLTGMTLAPAAGLLRELTRTDGQLSGEDLFVVRASDDMAVEWLREGDAVAAGDPLARFGSGGRAAKADELKARLARAEAERDVLALSPLTPDPELTRRHQGTAQERAQVQQELGQAVAAAEAADRDLTAQALTKKEALARLERTLTERRKDLERATIRSAHARDLVYAYADLRARGTISVAEYQEHEKTLRDATVEVSSLAQELKDGLAEKEILRAHLDRLDAGRSDPTAPLHKQVASLRARLTKLEAEEADLKARLDQDLARSTRLREAEKVQAVAKVREHQAALAGLAGEQEVRAPFAGRIAYRAPSPNATRARGTLLVLGPENGFRLTARLARAEADALRDGGEVTIEVGEDSPERRIPARFRKAADLAYEPGHAALQLECQPPPEVVRRLAEGEKLTVAFAWHPPLAGMWPFRAGVLLAAAGVIGLFLTRKPAPTQALARWGWPAREPGPGVNGFGPRVREMVRDGRIDAGVRAALEHGEPRRLLAEPVAADDMDIPDSPEELEECCRVTMDRLNRAECPVEATRLLEHLHQLRRALRSIDLPTPPHHRNGDGRTVVGAGS